MKGSIFKRGNLWTVQVELDQDPVSGRRRKASGTPASRRGVRPRRIGYANDRVVIRELRSKWLQSWLQPVLRPIRKPHSQAV